MIGTDSIAVLQKTVSLPLIRQKLRPSLDSEDEPVKAKDPEPQQSLNHDSDDEPTFLHARPAPSNVNTGERHASQLLAPWRTSTAVDKMCRDNDKNPFLMKLLTPTKKANKPTNEQSSVHQVNASTQYRIPVPNRRASDDSFVSTNQAPSTYRPSVRVNHYTDIYENESLVSPYENATPSSAHNTISGALPYDREANLLQPRSQYQSTYATPSALERAYANTQQQHRLPERQYDSQNYSQSAPRIYERQPPVWNPRSAGYGNKFIDQYENLEQQDRQATISRYHINMSRLSSATSTRRS